MSEKTESDVGIAGSLNELAEVLGITRQTLHKWRGEEGAPEGMVIEEWKDFLNDRPRFSKKDAHDMRRKALLVQIEEEKLRKLRLANDRTAGDLIPVDEVVEIIATMTAKWDAALTVKLDHEGPARVIGLESAECRVEFQRLHDELREISHGLFTWDPS